MIIRDEGMKLGIKNNRLMNSRWTNNRWRIGNKLGPNVQLGNASVQTVQYQLVSDTN